MPHRELFCPLILLRGLLRQTSVLRVIRALGLAARTFADGAISLAIKGLLTWLVYTVQWIRGQEPASCSVLEAVIRVSGAPICTEGLEDAWEIQVFSSRWKQEGAWLLYYQ